MKSHPSPAGWRAAFARLWLESEVVGQGLIGILAQTDVVRALVRRG